MKKIIVLYSTGGMGHKKAAEAIVEELNLRHDGFEFKAIDSLEYGNSLYKYIYKDMYVYLMTKGKKLWGFLYRLTNLPFVDKIIRPVREYAETKSIEGLVNALIEENPDAVVATHFNLPNIARFLKRKKAFKGKLYTVVTDYGPHSFWMSEYIDRYFVGSNSAKEEFIKRGVPEEKLFVTGIPSSRVFSKEFDVEALKKKYEIIEGRKTVFLLSGGFGVGPLEEMLHALNDCTGSIQSIVVCGHNDKFYQKIDRQRDEFKYPVILFGFTDKVAELMAISDLIITKAGGISTTEALNARLPMILYASVPGQETWNEEMLLQNHAALKAEKVNDIPGMVDSILTSARVRESLAEGIKKLRKPDAAKRIVDIMLEDGYKKNE